MDLVDLLKAKQGRKTQEEFAAELGVDQSSLSLIFARKVRVGPKIAARIRRRYPRLKKLLADYLMSEEADHSAAS